MIISKTSHNLQEVEKTIEAVLVVLDNYDANKLRNNFKYKFKTSPSLDKITLAFGESFRK